MTADLTRQAAELRAEAARVKAFGSNAGDGLYAAADLIEALGARLTALEAAHAALTKAASPAIMSNMRFG